MCPMCSIFILTSLFCPVDSLIIHQTSFSTQAAISFPFTTSITRSLRGKTAAYVSRGPHSYMRNTGSVSDPQAQNNPLIHKREHRAKFHRIAGHLTQKRETLRESETELWPVSLSLIHSISCIKCIIMQDSQAKHTRNTQQPNEHTDFLNWSF